MVFPAPKPQHPALATTRSNLPSPLRSATAAPSGSPPAVAKSFLAKAIFVATVTEKYAGFDAPPPGLGLTTVTDAVPATAMSEAGTAAVNCDALTKCVCSGPPFQYTVVPETKPEPFKVSVKAAAPGAWTAGDNGWFINGTGLAVCCGCWAVVTSAEKPIAHVKIRILDFMLFL